MGKITRSKTPKNSKPTTAKGAARGENQRVHVFRRYASVGNFKDVICNTNKTRMKYFLQIVV